MRNLYNITTTHEAMRRLFPRFGDMTIILHERQGPRPHLWIKQTDIGGSLGISC